MVNGDRVKVRAPTALPMELRNMLRAYRSGVLDYLRQEEMSNEPPFDSSTTRSGKDFARDELKDILLRVEAEGCVFLWSKHRGELMAVYDTAAESSSIPPAFLQLSRHELVQEFSGDGHGSGPTR